MNLTKVQENAVNKIVNYYQKHEKLVNFTAPTGSGKTFMIANVISRIIQQNINKKVIFIVFTLSNAELPIQFKNKLNDYQDSLITKFNSIYYDSPSSSKNKSDSDYFINFANHNVLIFGTSSFGRSRVYSELGIFNDFIFEAKSEGYEIIYIRDEAHIGDKNHLKTGKTEQELLNQQADFIIKMTATPDINNLGKIVYISEKDVNDEDDDSFLLKTTPHFNPGFKTDIINDNDILNTAIKTFKEIKIKYHKKEKITNKIINPAMLIQIGSKNQFGESIEEDDKRIDAITSKLDEHNLSWVIYLSDRKESSLKEAGLKKKINLKEISKNNSEIDVILFKIGPATGWDIPRACMLVQLRRVCSDKLNQQTIGRIKRNPKIDLKKDDLYMQYWIYSDHQEKSREVHKYILQDKFKETKIPSIIAADKNIYIGKERNLQFYKEIIIPFIRNKKSEFIDLWREIFSSNKQEIPIKQINYSSNEDKSVFYLQTLNNFIDIKLFIASTKENNHWMLDLNFNECYMELFKIDNNLTKDQFFLILCKDYIIELNSLRKEYFTHEAKYQINYNNVLPPSFIVYEGKDNDVDFKEISEIYGYQYVLFDDEIKSTKQYLDSKPESIYLKFLIDKIIDKNLLDKIELFAKNPLQSKIYFEYWKNEESRYAKAYIDFILKIKDKNQYIFIEIKSKDDYDENKTESIKKELINYEKHIKDAKADIYLGIVVIDKKELMNYNRCFDSHKKGVFVHISNNDNNPNYKNIDDIFDSI